MADADRGMGAGGPEPFPLIITTRTQTDTGWLVPGSDWATPVLSSLALVDKRVCWKSYQKIMPSELPLAARTANPPASAKSPDTEPVCLPMNNHHRLGSLFLATVPLKLLN